MRITFPSYLPGPAILPQNFQAVRYFDIGPNEAGQRIDNYLLKVLKNVPRSHIYRLLRSGQVRVNKGRIKPAYRLVLGDRLRLPPVQQSVAETVRPPDALCQRLLGRILHEDDDLLILDKPAGLAVHGGSGLKFGLIETMRFARGDVDYLELAHRLDRATSGCLVLAKSRAALTAVHEGFRQGSHEKRYLTLLQGAWTGGAQTVTQALLSQRSRGGERIVEADDEGKDSVSHFDPLDIWPQASLMEVLIDTGRMHQIRVHAAGLGHPVAGDDKYGDKEADKALRAMGLRRMFLHAHSLKLKMEDEYVQVTAPLPAELSLVIDNLRKQE